MAKIMVEDLRAEGGQVLRRDIDCARIGEVRRALVLQTDGALEGFAWGLFDAEVACQPGLTQFDPQSARETSLDPRHGPDEKDRTVPVAMLESHQVFPVRTAPAGADRAPEPPDFQPPVPYRNHDGSQTNLKRKLYLMIRAQGKGPKSFTFVGDLVPTA